MRIQRTRTGERGAPLAMRLRLAAASYRFRESLFQMPALIVLGGVFLAEVTVAVDRSFGADRLPFT